MKTSFLLLAAPFLASTVACTTEPGPDRGVVVVPTGTLIVDWTVDGTKDPAECRATGADAIDITVQTTSGAQVGEFQEACDSFATSIDLAADDYTADAVLIDAGGADRTTSVPINPFTIVGDDELTVPIDFPADSFRSN
jgi:hypothetical protein